MLLRNVPGAKFEALREISFAAKLQVKKQLAARKIHRGLKRLFV